MNAIVGRRYFVGTLAAGLPLVAARDDLAAQGSSLRGASGLEAELLRQLREGIRGMQGNRRGEAARRVAATLRVVIADLRAKNVDGQFAAYLRDTLARNGEAAVLSRDITPFVAGDLRDFGIRSLPRVSDYAMRQQALRLLQSRGLTASLAAVADAFDELSVGLERYPVVTISRQADSCPDLQLQLRIVEAAMIAACLFNPVACAIFSGLYVGLLIGLSTMGC
jgi:hypothetical protein